MPAPPPSPKAAAIAAARELLRIAMRRQREAQTLAEATEALADRAAAEVALERARAMKD